MIIYYVWYPVNIFDLTGLKQIDGHLWARMSPTESHFSIGHIVFHLLLSSDTVGSVYGTF